ncbi:LysR family transcriptional regulator [Variovorax terrae]|uniref:LysR substrate-binding domain-containing protein n=1 Tax=Variovorax terrae TaxID=2923278 RepID=A0A9X1VY30_9BURK|nr:LysR family transcriptional regulator [Variovorax terrae]MCJ0765445.1 LysR substrate-binding domain-containing protein [Variovorax terrae]
MKHLPSVRQLRAFVAVYQSGHLSAAAEMLSLTQPAVTVLLRELEEKLGVRLFDRTTRTLRRTDAAAEAIAYAERALAELDAMGASMAELAGSRRGRLRIAATSTVAQTLLPRAVRRFMDLYPQVQVLIDDCAPGEFVEHVLGERVDLGVGTLEAPTAGLREQVFLRDGLAAVALASAAFADGRPITWKQLAALPLITVKPGYGVRRRIDQAAETAQVKLTVVHEVSLLTTAIALASSGLGVAVVPASTAAAAPYPGLAVRRLVRPSVERNTAVVFKPERSLPPPAQAFADLLAREFGQR